MFIAKQVADLPEVGHCINEEARSIDYAQECCDKAQESLNLRRAAFLEELKENWSAEEMQQAGLFA